MNKLRPAKSFTTLSPALLNAIWLSAIPLIAVLLDVILLKFILPKTIRQSVILVNNIQLNAILLSEKMVSVILFMIFECHSIEFKSATENLFSYESTKIAAGILCLLSL
jgi:hypothetical protein